MHGFVANFTGELRHLLAELRQGLDELCHSFIALFFHNQCSNLFAELFQSSALVRQNFAPKQVQALYGVGAFINHIDACITHILLHAPLTYKTMAAKHLQARRCSYPTVVGDEGFDNGSEQRYQLCTFSANSSVRVVEFAINQESAIQTQRTSAFCISLGSQQHFANIWVHQNAVCGFAEVFWTCQTSRLNSVFGIGQCILIGHLCQPERLHAHANARRIHHHEHGGEAFIRLPNQSPLSIFQNHLASSAAINAHLVF